MAYTAEQWREYRKKNRERLNKYAAARRRRLFGPKRANASGERDTTLGRKTAGLRDRALKILDYSDVDKGILVFWGRRGVFGDKIPGASFGVGQRPPEEFANA